MENKKEYRVIFYESADGCLPVEDFIKILPVKVRAKLAKWIEKLQGFGLNLPRPYADVVKGKIRELRVIFASQQYRFLYFFHFNYIIITHGFIKKQDRVPEKEIQRAEYLMCDFLERLEKGQIQL